MLSNHWVDIGHILFRWRSYIPLALTPLFVIAAVEVGGSLTHGRWHRAPEIVGLGLSLIGLALRGYVVGTAPRGTSGRNTRQQKAVTLNTRGPYSVMRHPLYVANTVMALGLATSTGHRWLPLLVVVAALLYYERIVAAEEAFLEERFGDEFRTWASRVPAMWPRLRARVPAPGRFSWRRVWRSEIHALGVIGGATFVIEVLKHYAERGRLVIDAPSLAISISASLVFLAGWPGKKVAHRSRTQRFDTLMVFVIAIPYQ